MWLFVLLAGFFGTFLLIGAMHDASGCMATAGIVAIGLAILIINVETLEEAGWIPFAIGCLIGLWFVESG